jgi:hypothetical protein
VVSPVQLLTPTVVVNSVSTTYDGNPHGTTGEAFGAGGVDLGPVPISYSTPDGNAPVDAGTYTATGTFPGNQDYTSATGTATITIGQATPTVVVNSVNTTYDGNAHGTTGEAFGVGGVDLGPVSISYNTPDGSEPVHAGTYTATGTFPGNQDYTTATGTATITIGQATPTLVVNSVSTTYDGGPHGTTGKAFGVGGVDLGPVAISYDSPDGSAPVHAGSYTATGTYPGNQDYTSATGTASIVIDRAIPTASIDPVAERPYDGLPRGTTGQVVGVNGIVLSNTVVYTDSHGNTLGGPPVHAGTYTASVSYPGNNDYTSASASTTIVIDKADATIKINPFFVTYDGQAHRLTGTATGVQGEDLSSLLDLGTVGFDAGTYWEFWTFNFDGSNPDYNSATGLDPFIIDPAPLTVTVPNLGKTYGQAINLGATLGTTIPTGVNGETLNIAYTSAGAAASADVLAGGYPITAQLSNGTGKLSNYSVQVIPGTLTINRANQTINWSNPADIIYRTALSATQLNATVTVVGPAPAGTLSYTPPAGTVLGPGQGQVLSVTAAATPDYNAASAAVTTNVDYNFSGFLKPVNQPLIFGVGRTIPIRFYLTDAFGNYISTLSAVTALQVIYPDGSKHAISGLLYDPTANQYVANWKTKGLVPGSYTISLSLLDGTTHTEAAQITAPKGSAGLTTTAAGGTSAASGSLLGGNLQLYVDNTNGDLTADELARIQDAVTAADAVTEPYGVAVVEVTDPTLADVTLNMDTTSAVGGYAAGVLGCTTDAGQITIITGWNFYAGSDATQIGSAQYDFETVVEHELGHALGLGHSTDSTSVMYATLNTGTVNRTLTTADLKVPDTGTTGACGLHAGVDVGRISNPSYDESGRDAFFTLVGNAPSTGSVNQITQRPTLSNMPAILPPIRETAPILAARIDAVFAGSQQAADDVLIDMAIIADEDVAVAIE